MDRIERATVIDENDVSWPVDGNGDRIPTKKKGSNADMSLAEWCELNLKAAHPRNFQGSQASGGSGDPAGAGGAGGTPNEGINKLAPEQRLTALREAAHR